jgi:hypothetical protein
MGIKTIFESVLEEIEKGLEKNIERKIDIAYEYIMRGENRKYPCMYLNRGPDPTAGVILGKDRPKKQTPKERVPEKLKGILSPLKLLNPIKPEIPPGRSVGNLPDSFGVQLIPESGIPEIKEEIGIILSYTLWIYWYALEEKG